MSVVVWMTAKSADAKDFDAAKSRLDAARAAHQFDVGISAMDSYLHGGWYRANRYEAYIYIGTMYEMKGEWSDALAAYRNAESHNPGGRQAEYGAIARVSERMGDKATAVQYYEKQLNAMQSTGTPDAEDVAWLKKRIATLGANK
jgi:tetratricopeptide (TPR) repeat protein